MNQFKFSSQFPQSVFVSPKVYNWHMVFSTGTKAWICTFIWQQWSLGGGGSNQCRCLWQIRLLRRGPPAIATSRNSSKNLVDRQIRVHSSRRDYNSNMQEQQQQNSLLITPISCGRDVIRNWLNSRMKKKMVGLMVWLVVVFQASHWFWPLQF